MSTSEQLQGAVALVTGASSGISEATAIALAEHGARVAIVARHDGLQELANPDRRRRANDRRDVSDVEQAQRAVQQTVDDLGWLDILINSAGVIRRGPIVDAPLEECEHASASTLTSMSRGLVCADSGTVVA